MKKKLLIGLSIAVAVVLVGGAMVKANFDGWDIFFSEAGKVFGFELAKKTEIPSQSSGVDSDMAFGVAGDTFSSPKIAQAIITTSTVAGVTSGGTDTASNTMASMLNPTAANGGRTRRILRAEFFTASSSATLIGPMLVEFGTSTNQYTTSSRPLNSQTFVSSSDPISFTVSTTLFGAPWRGIWKAGEYFQCAASHGSISTTYAYCLAEYVNLD